MTSMPTARPDVSLLEILRKQGLGYKAIRLGFTESEFVGLSVRVGLIHSPAGLVQAFWKPTWRLGKPEQSLKPETQGPAVIFRRVW